jgi:glutamate 5-kinase
MAMSKKVVIKVGTSTLLDEGKKLNEKKIEELSEQIATIWKNGYRVILVTSGAIVTGMKILSWDERPKRIVDSQVCAAVGQGELIHMYFEKFRRHNIYIGQILLTRDDFSHRERYLNLRNTLTRMLELNILPIINENDTVSVEEIRIGDNDTLSAIVASKICADYLILLTDVDGLYPDEPQKCIKENIKPIPEVHRITDEIEKLAGYSAYGSFGVGGMKTKIEAAKIVTRSGGTVIIANGKIENVLLRILLNKEQIGTKFLPVKEFTQRERWIAFGRRMKGKIYVDDGAKEALILKNKSLLPTGIVRVEGKFRAGDMVSINDLEGNEIARGLVYYSSEEIEKIKGKKSSEIPSILGEDKGYEEVIHRDNMVIL